jgi:hypothetical protein
VAAGAPEDELAQVRVGVEEGPLGDGSVRIAIGLQVRQAAEAKATESAGDQVQLTDDVPKTKLTVWLARG